jgi:hypothetical protein
MEAMRQSWTDDRLDEFGHRIDERFDRVDERFDEVDRRFQQVDQRFVHLVEKHFDKVDERFGDVGQNIRELRAEMNEHNNERAAEFTALQRTIIQVGVALFSAMMGVIAAIVGVVITQL